MTNETKERKNFFNAKNIILSVLIIIFLTASFFGGIIYWKAKNFLTEFVYSARRAVSDMQGNN